MLLVQVNISDHEPRNHNEQFGEGVEFREQVDGVRKNIRGVMIENEQHRAASIEVDQDLSFPACNAQCSISEHKSLSEGWSIIPALSADPGRQGEICARSEARRPRRSRG